MQDLAKQKPAVKWKWLGAASIALPLAIVTLFAVGEGIGAEEGWWGHLIQLALGLALLAVGWLWPRIGGPLLIALGVVFSVLWIERDEWAGALIIMLPLLFAGVFFTLAGRNKNAPT